MLTLPATFNVLINLFIWILLRRRVYLIIQMLNRI